MDPGWPKYCKNCESTEVLVFTDEEQLPDYEMEDE